MYRKPFVVQYIDFITSSIYFRVRLTSKSYKKHLHKLHEQTTFEINNISYAPLGCLCKYDKLRTPWDSLINQNTLEGGIAIANLF